MNYLLNIISNFNERLCKILVAITGILLGLISIILFYSVLMRYAFNNPVTWSEDAAKILMVWMVLLGAPAGLREGSHVSIDMLLDKLPKLIEKIFRIFSIIVILFVAWIILYYGWKISIKGMRRIVPSMEWLKFGYAYLSLPIGYGIMILICIEQLLRNLIGLITNNEERKGAE